MNKLEWFEVLEQLELVDTAVINGRSTDFRIEFEKLYDIIYGKAENDAEHEGWYGEFEEYLDSLEDKYWNLNQPIKLEFQEIGKGYAVRV